MRHHHLVSAAATITGLVSVTMPDAAHARPIRFWTRADAMPADTYVTTTGHVGYDCSAPGTGGCAVDFQALRWDDDSGQWSTNVDGAENSASYFDRAVWEMPVYSPVDGEVISCWRRMPDDFVEGDDINCPGGDEICAGAGNHVVILTPEGDTVLLAHMRADTIPPSVCPFDDVYLYDDEGGSCGIGGMEWLRDASRPDVQGYAPILVEAGQFIGRVGTSGASGGPHMHMHVKPYAWDGANHCLGPTEPMEFVQSFLQERTPGVAPDPDGWTPLESDEPIYDGTRYIFWPDPIREGVDNVLLGGGTLVRTVDTGLDSGVAVQRNEVGALELDSFEISNGVFDMLDSYQSVAIKDVAATRLGWTRDVVVAYRNAADDLVVRTWDVAADGQISSVDLETYGDISAVDIARTTSVPYGVVTAVVNASGRLQVDGFAIPTGSLTITRGRMKGVGAPSQPKVGVTMVEHARAEGEVDDFEGAVTANLDAGGHLVVSTWSVDDDFDVGAVDTYTTIATASQLAITKTSPDFRDMVVTAIVNGAGELQVTSWEIDASGQVQPVDNAFGGATSGVGLASMSVDDVIVSVRNSGNALAMLGFDVLDDGGLRRNATLPTATPLSAAPDVAAELWSLDEYGVAGVRTLAGNLRLLSFPLNFYGD